MEQDLLEYYMDDEEREYQERWSEKNKMEYRQKHGIVHNPLDRPRDYTIVPVPKKIEKKSRWDESNLMSIYL